VKPRVHVFLAFLLTVACDSNGADPADGDVGAPDAAEDGDVGDGGGVRCRVDGDCPQPGRCDRDTGACVCTAPRAVLCGGACVPESVAACGTSCDVCPAPRGGTAACFDSLCTGICPMGLALCDDACLPDCVLSAAAPVAPTLVELRAVSTDAARLRWIDQSRDESGFRVDRVIEEDDGTETFEPVSTLPADTESVRLDGLSGRVCFRVVVVGASGHERATSGQCTNVEPDAEAPTLLTVSATRSGCGRVDLEFSARDATDFRVRRDGVDVATVRTGTWVDASLAPDARATYEVVAMDSFGNASEASDPVDATALSCTRVRAGPAFDLGGAGDDRVTALAPASEGGTYVAGTYELVSDLGLGAEDAIGGRDVFVLRADRDGAVQWVATVGGEADELLTEATSITDGVVVGGVFTVPLEVGTDTLFPAGGGDIFLIAMSEDATSGDATPRWATRLGGSGVDRILGLGTREDGRLVAVGSFEGSAEFGDETLVSAGGRDAFVVTLSAEDGRVLSAHSYGGAGHDSLEGVDRAGTVAAGSFEQMVAFGDDALVSRGETDGVLLGIGADGAAVWALQAGAEHRDRSILAESGPSGEIVYAVHTVAPSFERTTVQVLESSRAFRWDLILPFGAVLHGLSVHDGALVVVGGAEREADFGLGTLSPPGAPFLATYDLADGSPRYAAFFGRATASAAFDVAASGSALWLGGTFGGVQNPLWTGGDVLFGAGGDDGFVAAYHP